MPEITQQQFQDLLASNFKLAGSMGKAAEQMKRVVVDRARPGTGAKNADEARLSRDLSGSMRNLDSRIRSTTENITAMSGSAQEFGGAMDRMLRGLFGGYVLAEMVRGISNLTQTYQRLTDIGQTFGGSMVEMATQAGRAGLTLDQFAAVLERASGAAAVLAQPGGQGGLGALALEVRKNIREFGNFGMTLEDIGNLSADYAETLRLQGVLRAGNEQDLGRSAAKLAADFSEFSTLTGRSRRQLQQATNDALRDVAVTTRISRGLGNDQRRGMERTTAFLSALQGEAGDFMARNFTQAFGYGSALFMDGVRTFVDSGFNVGIGMIDRLAAQAASGRTDMEHMFEFVDEFVAEADNMNESLRMQALAGNENAKQVIRMRDQMRMLANMSHEERRRRMEDARKQQGLTKFATTFGDILNQLTGAFRAGLGEGLTGLAAGLDAMMSDGTVERFRGIFEGLGQSLASLLTSALTPKNINGFIDGFAAITDFVLQFVKGVVESGGLQGAFTAVGKVLGFVIDVFKGMASFGGAVVEMLKSLGLDLTGAGGSLGKFVGYLLGAGLAVAALAVPVLLLAAPFLLLKGAVAAVVGAFGTLAYVLGGFGALGAALGFLKRQLGIGSGGEVSGRGGNQPGGGNRGGPATPNQPTGGPATPNQPTGGQPGPARPSGGAAAPAASPATIAGQGGAATPTPGPATPAPAAGARATETPSPARPQPDRESWLRRTIRRLPGVGTATAIGGGIVGAMGSSSPSQAADALAGAVTGAASSTPLGMLLAPSRTANATLNASPDSQTEMMRRQQAAMERQAEELQRSLGELRERQQQGVSGSPDEQTRVLRRIEELMRDQQQVQMAIASVQENLARQQLRATERAGSGE